MYIGMYVCLSAYPNFDIDFHISKLYTHREYFTYVPKKEVRIGRANTQDNHGGLFGYCVLK